MSFLSGFLDDVVGIDPNGGGIAGSIGGPIGDVLAMGQYHLNQIASHPTRAITGVDPLSTNIWNTLTGSDNQPLTNWFGGPTDQQYADAAARGINTGPAQAVNGIADTIAGIYAGQGLGRLVNAGITSLGSAPGQTAGQAASGAGGVDYGIGGTMSGGLGATGGSSLGPTMIGSGGTTGGITSALSNLFGGNSGSGLNVLGYVTQAIGSQLSAQQLADAATDAGQQNLAIYQQQRADQAPWMAAGTNALGQLVSETQQGGQYNRPFTMEDAQNMPAYQFALQQGQQALNRQAAAGGQNLSAANLQGQMSLAEGLASQYQNQAFNQHLAENSQSLGALQSLAGLGQTATQQVGNEAQNYGTAAANAITNAGQARASGTLGLTNAIQGGISALGNYGNMMNTLSSLFAN